MQDSYCIKRQTIDPAADGSPKRIKYRFELRTATATGTFDVNLEFRQQEIVICQGDAPRKVGLMARDLKTILNRRAGHDIVKLPSGWEHLSDRVPCAIANRSDVDLVNGIFHALEQTGRFDRPEFPMFRIG